MSEGRAREILEGVGGCLTSIGGLLIFGVLIILFFKGAAWLASVILPISGWITLAALAIVPICLLLAIPRVTRAWGGFGLVLSSYAVGFTLWLWCLVVAFQLAGVFWLIVGLLLAGVGVVFVAAIASLLHAEWFILIQIVVSAVIVFVLRIAGYWLVEKAEPTDEYRPTPPSPPDFNEG